MVNIIALFNTGCCHHPEFITMKGGALKQRKFPSISVLLEHPRHGLLLIDTGYSEHFLTATQKLPYKLYRIVTPIEFLEYGTVKTQLNKLNIKPEEIRYIFITHFHADHIAGLEDFPNATYIASLEALEILEKKSNIMNLRHAFIKSLLPKNFKEKLLPIESLKIVSLDKNFSPFTQARTLFDDNSIFLIDLPGHALGHFGMFVPFPKPYFFIGDACWSAQAYQKLLFPHVIANLLFTNRSQYRKTIQKLHQLWIANNEINIVPSHCQVTLTRIQKALLSC